MKLNVIFSIVLLSSILSCRSKMSDEFVINGKITELSDSSEVYLSYMILDGEKWKEANETAYVKNGEFTFKGKITELTAAFLSFGNNSLSLYLEPTIMSIEIDKNRPWEHELSGTRAEKNVLSLNKILKHHEEELYKQTTEIFSILDKINAITENNAHRDSLVSVLKTNNTKRFDYVKQIDEIRFNYIIENKNSEITPVIIYNLARTNLIDIDKIASVYNDLSTKAKECVTGKLANKQIQQTQKVVTGKNISIGSAAPNFFRIDIYGNMIQLSERYSKNYILLDFWASWCAPCLQQVPQIRKLQDLYSKKGIEIIGLSVDKDKEQWINAIKKNKLDDWTQILCTVDSDSDYFDSDISDDYGVEVIPAYYLIDRQGKIVAKWSHINEEQIQFIDKVLMSN